MKRYPKINQVFVVTLITLVLSISLVACGSSLSESGEAPAQEKSLYNVDEDRGDDYLTEEPAEEAAAQSMPMDAESPIMAALPTSSPSSMARTESDTTGLSTGGSAIPNDEPYDSMYFESAGVNPFVDTEDDHFSTFAMDVDTASYSVVRRYLNDGHLPPADAIRVEEFVNYFDLYYPEPEDEQSAFAIHLEGAPAPFGPTNAHLLKIDLQGKTVRDENRKPASLTFVIDVSGSMDRENRLGLVKQALHLLVNELRPDDMVSLVVYGSTAQIILQPTEADQTETILTAIDGLHSTGSTNAEAGLRLGYDMAVQAFRPKGINRVILLSDGVANVGNTGPKSILQVIQHQVDQGITLSTIGVGMGNYNDVLMEQLANNGDGNYAYVDTLDEANRVFVENLTGLLQVIGKDAKVQVEFDPTIVRSYRLLGYENRDVADQDFRNDTVDAGEVGAGHRVTALYEIKFHDDIAPADNALTVYIRYQDMESGQVVELSQPFKRGEFIDTLEESSAKFRFIASVAEYAEILRESYWAKESSMTAVSDLASPTIDFFDQNEEVIEFMQLVNRAAQLRGEATQQ